MFYYTYKITCLCEPYKGYYYLGQRRAQTLPDKKYAGSGLKIIEYYKEFGKVEGLTYTKEILEFYNNAEELNKAEAELIGDKWKTDSFCLNLAAGGKRMVHQLTEEQKIKISESTKRAMQRPEVKNKLLEGIKDRKGHKHTEEFKERQRERMKLNNPAKNGLTEEWKRKIGNASKGRTVSEEQRKIRSERMKQNNPMKNKETAKKVSEAIKGKPLSEEHKKKISIAVKKAKNKTII